MMNSRDAIAAVLAQRQGAPLEPGIRATPWYAEYVQKYGEPPDLNTLDYDYRAAWAAGARPTVRDPMDQMLHWPSRFKGESHPNRYVDDIDTITGEKRP